MAHAAAAGAGAEAAIAAVGLAVLEPELLVHALLFVDHAEAMRTASTCKALRSSLLGAGCPDTAFLWRTLLRRRFLFGLRRRHRPQQQASEAAALTLGQDFLAFRTRHAQMRRMAEGQAGMYHVETVRPPADRFVASLLESEEEMEGQPAEDGTEGPVAYLGGAGFVMRVGYPSAGNGDEGPRFGIVWQYSPPPLPNGARATMKIAREGNVLACGTHDGQLFFLHAGTGQPLALQQQEGAEAGDAEDEITMIDTGLPFVASLLWLEGGRRIAVACSTDTHVKLYCPRTGVLCQDIGPSPMANNAVAADPLFPAGVQPDAVCGLLSRKEEGGGEPSPRPHFLVLTRTQARFFVQDTVAETPDISDGAAAGADGFRPYSEHGRVVADPDSMVISAMFAPAVGGLPRDAADGVYRVFMGVRNRGVQTTTFRVHPRIRLAQLFQADGSGPLSPLRALILPGHGVSDVITTLKVRSVRVPKPAGALGSDRALLLGYIGLDRAVEVFSLHELPHGPDGADDEPTIECCLVMRRMIDDHARSTLLMDDEKVLLATDKSTVQVNALPRNPAPYPVSSDPAPVRGRFDSDQPLYSLRGGSVTMGSGSDLLGAAVGAAEVLVLYSDKLRLYDFSP